MAVTMTITTPLTRSEATNKVANLPVDGSYEVTIRKAKTSRSVRQNNLYWEWLGIIRDNTGMDVDTLHLFFKRKFLGLQSREIFGECVVDVRDSHNLSVGEFADYMTQVMAFAETELNIELPSA